MLEALTQLKESLPSLSSFNLGNINLNLGALGIGGKGVGLDIGEERVRAVRLKKRDQHLIMAGVGVSDIAYPGNEGATTKAVLEALEGAGKKKRDPLACSIGGPQVVIKSVKLPPLPLNRVLDAVKWHFQENGLLPLGDAVFDAQVLKPANGDQMKILAVCAPNALIQRRLKILEAAHLTPRHVDVEPLVTLNAFLALEGLGQDETLVLVSMNKPVPFVCVFNRQSGDTLIRYMPEAFENPTAAVENIRTSVAYYQAEIAAGSNLRCVYCGKEELFAELREKMTNLLVAWNLTEAPANFDPLAIMEWESSILQPGKSIDGTELVQAVGLALRAL